MRPPRILIVGLPSSIHTARDIEMIAGRGWDLHMFSSLNLGLHPWLADVTVHLEPGSIVSEAPEGVTLRRLEQTTAPPGGLTPPERAEALAGLIETLQPDLIHSMESQRAGYLTLAAKRLVGDPFPFWMHHNWGVDISFYHRDPAHRAHLRALLSECDYYWAETERDTALARALGFTGEVAPVVAITGGYDLAAQERLRAPGPTSARTAIAAKGQSGTVYRPETVIAALERIPEHLAGRELLLYLAAPEIEERAGAVCAAAGATLEVISRTGAPASHEAIMRMHGRARVSTAMALGDGYCTSFLDAIAMGAFPVFSDPGGGCELAVRGRDGFFPGADDVEGTAVALARALSDDELVDRATDRNLRSARLWLDRSIVTETWAGCYERALAGLGAADRSGEPGGSLAGVSTEAQQSGEVERARQAYRRLCADPAADPDELSRLRRRLLEIAFLAGRSTPESFIETGELWDGLDPAARDAVIADMAWALARQAEQLEAAAAVADPEPVDPDLLLRLDEDRWFNDVERLRQAAAAAEGELAALRAADTGEGAAQAAPVPQGGEAYKAELETRLADRREEIAMLRARLAEAQAAARPGVLARLRRRLSRPTA